MLALIFTCATTKAIHADSIGVLKTPSQENSEVVVLGDKDFLYLERKEGVWHLMSCEGSSLCGEVDMNDIEVDKIASYLIDSDLESHIKDYCTPEKEDYLCELFASSLELAQRKTDRNWAVAGAVAGAVAVAVAVAVAGAGAWAGAWAWAVALAVAVTGAGALAGAVAVAGAGAGAVAGAVVWAVALAVAVAVTGAGAVAGAGALVWAVAGTIFGIKFSKDFFIAQEDIKKIRKELRKILEENAQNDFGFTGMP